MRAVTGDYPLTRLEYREAREALRRAAAGPVRLLDPLPWRVRLRLRLTGHVDSAAYWLACHDHPGAAERLYRATGMW